MSCTMFAQRISPVPDFGPLDSDIAFEELWMLKRAFLDLASYGTYDLLLLQQPVQTLTRL